MTDKKIEAIIDKSVKRAVKESWKEFKDRGALKSQTQIIYKDMSKYLRCYFKDINDSGTGDPKVKNALDQIADDRFYTIIPDYYGNGYTLEELAARLQCDISTITRNKKRLCVEIYELMEDEE